MLLVLVVLLMWVVSAFIAGISLALAGRQSVEGSVPLAFMWPRAAARAKHYRMCSKVAAAHPASK
jgi:hypothetical protein